MTAKETADKLHRRFYCALPNNGSPSGLCSSTQRWGEAKTCALIAVEELLKLAESADKNANAVFKKMYPKEVWSQAVYWESVKKEIEDIAPVIATK